MLNFKIVEKNKREQSKQEPHINLDKKIKKFDRKVISDFLIPIFASIIATLLTLAVIYAK